jgi:membrane protease subunit (stomatin/prohibitin family)
MLSNLPLYEQTVRQDLDVKFKKEGFILDGFNIISLPRPVDNQLASAINNKIIAKQNAETSKQQLEISVNEALKKAANARGDSAESVIRAAGEALAIQKLQMQVTPLYIDYIRAQSWNGVYPSTMLGSGSQTLLNLK